MEVIITPFSPFAQVELRIPFVKLALLCLGYILGTHSGALEVCAGQVR